MSVTSVEAEEAKSFRCTMDFRRFIWDKGGGCLSIFDLAACEVLDYEGFWLQKDKKKPMRGVFGIGNVDCTKIFASAYDGNSQQILIFHQHNRERVMKQASQEYSSYITTWMCVERSLSQEHIYVGGMNVETPTIGALAFNDSLAPISFLKLTKVKSRSLSRIKRIEGTDFVIAGLIHELLILRFDQSEFSLLHTLSTYSDYEISAIQFHSNSIYFMTLGDQSLSVLEFSSSVTQSEYINTGIAQSSRAAFTGHH